MSTVLLDAFELLAHAEQLELRLHAAAAELSKRQGLTEEKAWVELASARVAAAREGTKDLTIRALRLPELDELKDDHARLLQGAVVDALERVHAGITVAGGPRAPLLEALYYKVKVPPLRKCVKEDFERFCTEFQKRLRSTYAQRMLSHPEYAVVGPPLDALNQAISVWRGVFTSPPLSEEEARPLREELLAAAKRLDLPCRQGRLLAQAALVPLRLLDDHGVSLKPKRRSPRAAGELDEDTHALLEDDPPDPLAPTPEELSEIERARGETASAS